MATLDQTIDALIAAGIEPDMIAKRALARASQSTKEYFLSELLVPDSDPPVYVVNLSVSNWAAVTAFFRKPTTEDYHPQRIFQEIANDIQESVATHNEQKFINSLLLGVKAVQP